MTIEEERVNESRSSFDNDLIMYGDVIGSLDPRVLSLQPIDDRTRVYETLTIVPFDGRVESIDTGGNHDGGIIALVIHVDVASVNEQNEYIVSSITEESIDEDGDILLCNESLIDTTTQILPPPPTLPVPVSLI